MRRRRRPLQVSLFPFLAVLLCTLGSLILLLLVLDQRSRQQAAAEAALREQQTDDQAAEVEEHLQRLMDQRHELAGRTGELQQARMGKASLLEAQQAELAELQARLKAEKDQVAGAEQALRQKETETAQAVAVSAAVRSESDRLLNQVTDLERTVKRLQEAAQKPRQPVYSLVPYKGKQGTRQQPIYLECISGQAVFRPDGDTLSSNDLKQDVKLQEAVRKRADKVAETGQKPYVLLLIRPSGIPLYYDVLRALQGSSIEVGYELLEEDWALDFTERPVESAVAASEVKPVSSVLPAKPASGLAAAPPPASVSGGPPRGILAAPRPSISGMGAAAESQPNEGRGAQAEPPPADADRTENAPPAAKRAPPAVGPATQEYEILIECSATAIIVHPQKIKLDTATLASFHRGDNPLLQTVRDLVEQKKSKSADLRPQVHFAIRPDGLRTYYQASAALEALKLPKTWQILEDGADLDTATRRGGVR